MFIPEKYVPWTHAALRIVAGAAFAVHGAQKLLGWFGGVMGGGTVDFMSRFGVAGTIELVGGVLIMIGLFTKVAAFIASGEMAVAYFWVHGTMGGGYHLFWWQNNGEIVMLFSFIFLWLAAAGAGPLSLDARLAKK